MFLLCPVTPILDHTLYMNEHSSFPLKHESSVLESLARLGTILISFGYHFGFIFTPRGPHFELLSQLIHLLLNDELLGGVAVLGDVILVEVGEGGDVGCVDAVDLLVGGAFHFGHGDGGAHHHVDRPPVQKNYRVKSI